jgi:hypothetical protein
MRIIPRAEWNARPPKNRVTTAPSTRRYYVVHHSGGPAGQTVRAIQDWCMDGRGFSDIDYNFLIRATTGEIYEGRGWDVVGAHTTNYNTNGVGVCLIGTDQASDAAKTAVRWLYDQYNKRCSRTLLIHGHRELATTGTDCPGDKVFAWVHAGMPAPAPIKEDGDMTEAEMRKLAGFIAEAIMASPVDVNGQKWRYDTAIGYQTRKAYEIDLNTEAKPTAPPA